jgi:hypothetical protein
MLKSKKSDITLSNINFKNDSLFIEIKRLNNTILLDNIEELNIFISKYIPPVEMLIIKRFYYFLKRKNKIKK